MVTITTITINVINPAKQTAILTIAVFKGSDRQRVSYLAKNQPTNRPTHQLVSQPTIQEANGTLSY